MQNAIGARGGLIRTRRATGGCQDARCVHTTCMHMPCTSTRQRPAPSAEPCHGNSHAVSPHQQSRAFARSSSNNRGARAWQTSQHVHMLYSGRTPCLSASPPYLLCLAPQTVPRARCSLGLCFWSVLPSLCSPVHRSASPRSSSCRLSSNPSQVFSAWDMGNQLSATRACKRRGMRREREHGVCSPRANMHARATSRSRS